MSDDEDNRPSFFRSDAYEAWQRGQGSEGHVWDLTPAWLYHSFWILLCIAWALLLFTLVARVSDYAEGPAVLRAKGRQLLSAQRAGNVSHIFVPAGQAVTKGTVLVELDSNDETGALASLDRQLDGQLVRSLADPADDAARRTVIALQAERAEALNRKRSKQIIAPFDGVVTDIRVTQGQAVQAGDPLVSMASTNLTYSLIAALPGEYRPLLRPGLAAHIRLEGFRSQSIELYISQLGSEVVGAEEVQRYLGATLRGSINISGAKVLVEAQFPTTVAFLDNGKRIELYDGMVAQASVRVRQKRMIVWFIPWLKDFVHDG